MKEARKFLHVESSQIPLVKIDYGTIKKDIINPVNGKPYKGIVLEGIFADLSNESVNNNNRYYDVPQYLQLLGRLREAIHTDKGVYGELEHPKSYAVDYNNVSHKILDVWYDESDMKVRGYVLILDTPKGRICKDIIESGGCLAISARAAGDEIDNPDGTKTGRVKLLTTYDLVYHPGFSNAVLQFKELNESQRFMQETANSKKGFSYIIYEDQLRNINESYNEYMKLNESINGPDKCFLEWFQENLNESKSEDKKIQKAREKTDIKKLQTNSPSSEEELEDNLSIATDQDLKEACSLKQKNKFFKQVKMFQDNIKQELQDQPKVVYDNSAGFMTDGFLGAGSGHSSAVIPE